MDEENDFPIEDNEYLRWIFDQEPVPGDDEIEATPIKLVCLHCDRLMDYERAIDPGIPPEVVKITQPHCDQCWNGDREGETWYNVSGKEVKQ